MDYTFTCPNCGQCISATPQMAGIQANCPNCNVELTVPSPDVHAITPDAPLEQEPREHIQQRANETFAGKLKKIGSAAFHETIRIFHTASLKAKIAIGILLLISVLCLTNLKSNVEVDAFIVTNGGENIKLGLVSVRAMPYAKAKKALAHLQYEYDETLKELTPQINDARKKLDQIAPAVADAENRCKIANDAVESAEKAFEATANNIVPECEDIIAGSNDESGALSGALGKFEAEILPMPEIDEAAKLVSGKEWNSFPKQKAEFLQALNKVKVAHQQAEAAADADVLKEKEKAGDTIDNLNEKIKDLSSRERFFDAMPAGDYTAKTDADGKCIMRLPLGQRWVFAAKADRYISDDDHEQYLWVVELPDNTHKLSLSNDNVLSDVEDPLGPLGPLSQ